MGFPKIPPPSMLFFSISVKSIVYSLELLSYLWPWIRSCCYILIFVYLTTRKQWLYSASKLMVVAVFQDFVYSYCLMTMSPAIKQGYIRSYVIILSEAKLNTYCSYPSYVTIYCFHISYVWIGKQKRT